MKPIEQIRILVVDDDPDVREAIVLALEDAGYRAEGAENGQAALSALGSGNLPDLILLDLMMPVMDGWEFRNRQMERPDWSAVPVVVISAGGNVEQKARNLEADGWLKKPISLHELIQEVERVLQQPRQPSSDVFLMW